MSWVGSLGAFLLLTSLVKIERKQPLVISDGSSLKNLSIDSSISFKEHSGSTGGLSLQGEEKHSMVKMALRTPQLSFLFCQSLKGVKNLK